MKPSLPVLLFVVVITVAATPAAAVEDPRFETYVPEPTLVPGDTTQVGVQLVNDAEDVDDQVKTAANVKAEMKSGSTPFTIRSGTQLLGSMPDGQPVTTAFTVEVPENIDPGTYRIPIEVTYEYDGDESETETVHATVRIEDRAYFQVVSTEGDVPVGGSGSVSVTVRNVGTKTAHNATITTQTGSPDIAVGQSGSATTFVDRWEPDETRTIEFDAQVTNEASAGSGTLTTSVSFEDQDGNARQSFPMDSGLTLLEAQSFGFENIESTLRVGEKGAVTATVRNEGPRPVSDVVVTLGELSPTLTPQETEYGLGDLAVDETATVRFPMTVAETAEPSTRRLPFTVTYKNENDDLQQAEVTYVSADVAPERDRFAFEDIESDLSVGEDGSVEMTVRNNGESAEDVVVTLLPTGQNVHPQETQYAIGTMDEGSSSTVSFPIEISDNAEAVPRQLSFQVTYEDSDGDELQTSPSNIRVPIEARSDRFTVETVDATMAIGGSDTLEIAVTNDGDEPVENVNAKIFADDPLSANDDEAYIDRLEPGETKTITFSIAVSSGALAKAYPLSMDFQYEEDGESKLSDTYQIPVTATESEGSGLPMQVLVGAGLVVVVAAGALYWYRRSG